MNEIKYPSQEYPIINRNICVVTVTYGDRFIYLSQVISSVLDQGINKIFIVDNNSCTNSLEKLENLLIAIPDKISLIKLSKNTGSANGFKVGMEAAVEEFNFIWLLDDDNKPRKNALKVLVEFWNTYDKDKEFLCLASYREGWDVFKNSVITRNPDGPLYSHNGFRDFHFFYYTKKLLKKIFSSNTRNDKKLNTDFGELSVVPYGGMFFHTDMLSKIGFPNTNYYFYHDDYEFSYRIKKSRGKLLLLLSSCIDSLEQSWHVNKFGPEFMKLSRLNDPMRLYYNIRNKLIFELTEIVNNKWMYFLNMLIFTFLFICTSLIFFRFRNILIYLEAIFDGLNRNVGENKKYKNFL